MGVEADALQNPLTELDKKCVPAVSLNPYLSVNVCFTNSYTGSSTPATSAARCDVGPIP